MNDCPISVERMKALGFNHNPTDEYVQWVRPLTGDHPVILVGKEPDGKWSAGTSGDAGGGGYKFQVIENEAALRLFCQGHGIELPD